MYQKKQKVLASGGEDKENMPDEPNR
jgi:hypothetical protein